MDIFRGNSQPNFNFHYVSPEHLAYTNIESQYDDLTLAMLKSHFTLMTIHKSKSNDAIMFNPVQAKQFCYVDSAFNVQCRMVEAKHTYLQTEGSLLCNLKITNVT